MGTALRDPRSTSLSPDVLLALADWKEAESNKAIAKELGIDADSLSRSIRKGTMAKAVHDLLMNALRRRRGFSTPGPAVDLADPAVQIEQLCYRTHQVHYVMFDPARSADYLFEFLGHQALQQLPPKQLMNHLLTTLAVARQWLFGLEQIFLQAARICLKRLHSLSADDKGEKLAALACAVAWEIVAFVVQRGGVEKGIRPLNDVDATLKHFGLSEALTESRRCSIQKMQHYACNIALAGKEHADVKPLEVGERIGNIMSEAKILRPAEMFNLLQHKFMELLSLALLGGHSDEQRITQFFKDDFQPHFTGLTNWFQENGLNGMDKIVTPATADAATLYTALYAERFRTEDSDDLLDRARSLHKALHQKGCGMLNMQRANRQLVAAVKDLHGRRWPDSVPRFALATDIIDPAVDRLLDYSARILAAARSITRTA